MSDEEHSGAGVPESSSLFLSNAHLEFLALRLICSDRPDTRSKSLAAFKQGYFYNEGSKLAIRRIRSIAQQTGHQMSWSELTNDSVLPKDFRGRLKSYIKENANEDAVVSKKLKRRLKEAKDLRGEVDFIPQGTVDSVNTVEIVSKLLDDYSRTRMMWDFIRRTVKSKSMGEYNVDEAYADLKATAAHAQVQFDEETVFTHEGVDDNADDLVEEVLQGIDDLYIPTGFKTFDDINGGIMRGSLMIVGANTSGGKSAVTLQLAMNAARHGAKICYVPLEMTPYEMMQRQLANLSKIEITKLIKPENLSLKQKKHIKKSYKDFSDTLANRGGKLSIFSPPESMDMDGILHYLKPYEYDMIIIDYIGLLGGLDGEDQWRAMTSATRSAKLFAMINNCAVVCAAQLTEDGQTRNSRSMLDNANLAWFWEHNSVDAANRDGDEDEEVSYDDCVINVRMPKSRNQKAMALKLHADFAIMTITDYNPDMSEMTMEEVRKASYKDAVPLDVEGLSDSSMWDDEDVDHSKIDRKRKKKKKKPDSSHDKNSNRRNKLYQHPKGLKKEKNKTDKVSIKALMQDEAFVSAMNRHFKKTGIRTKAQKNLDTRSEVLKAARREFAATWIKGQSVDGKKDETRLKSKKMKRKYTKIG